MSFDIKEEEMLILTVLSISKIYKGFLQIPVRPFFSFSVQRNNQIS